MASTHAAMLADALGRWFAGALPEEEALAEYHRQRNEQALEIYRTTVWVVADLCAFAAARERLDEAGHDG